MSKAEVIVRSYSRVVARLRVMAGLGLPPELLVPEMAILMGKALGALTYPAVFVTDRVAAAQPHDFTVWLGADQTVRELRQLLKLGIWPGPSDTPSLQTIMAQRVDRQIFAATLWGEGCADEGPWGDLWRARGIQQGLQAVYFPASGRVVVIVIARATGAPPFSAADCAFGESVVPFFDSAIDGAATASDRYDESVPTVQLILDPDGKPGKMGFGTSEMLRDMGGGGPDAVEATLATIERAASSKKGGTPDPVMADPFIHLRRKAGQAEGGEGPLYGMPFAQNAFGRFSIRFSPLAGASGEDGQIATVDRKVPRALIALRGALRAGASARELQLVVALVRGATLEGASAALGVSLSSAKTMLERIKTRAKAESRSDALAHFIELGRGASW